ncbi:CpeT/CpcT family [Lutibacter oricola]|uniref:CpeT/CpcT family n=1 Tax=Lutibacter oricola TaxID=762486 RepID=A0A1H2S5X2_9FLAO|nr:chromophore lyase CpcT/CpeT [Lutibacter oricola]SDW26369.1 CpeT/CpcT family [Lutibacter oricola]
MKNLFVISVFVLALLTSCEQKPEITVETLASYMEGHFSSEKQSKQDSSYFHITLDMKKVPLKNANGIWLYVEQTAAKTPGKPYRQRFYHLEKLNDSTFSSSIYSMEDPKKYIGGHNDVSMFKDFALEKLTKLPGCALNLVYKNGFFEGETIEGACKNSWGKATYATSEVKVEKDKMISWDRGWNDAKEQVWGAEKGGYIFNKVLVE